MATLEQLNHQESLLKQKLEGTKNITERRKLRAELRSVRDQKEKLSDVNTNDTRTTTMSSKFTMSVNSTEKRKYEERTIRVNREESPARKENVAPQQPRSARSTFSFKMTDKDEDNSESRAVESSSWRRQTNHVKSSIDEKRPRKEQDLNNNNSDVKKAEKEEAPKRVSRRSSLAELFKIEQEGKQKPANPTLPPQVSASSSPVLKRLPMETHQDTKTKQDLLQNLGRLRGRRRSVREIERKEELEGLMYVKSGDTVKLVNTSQGDEQVKEQRKVRRSSRKESHEKLKVEGNTISNRNETELSAIQESPRSPNAKKRFGFGDEDNAAQKRLETPTQKGEAPKARIWQPPPPTDTNVEPSRPGRQWSAPSPQRVGPPRPNSFLPPKANEPPKFGRPAGGANGGGMGSVKDRMAFFRKAAEDEKKAKEKQFVPKSPTTPVNRFTAPSPTSSTAPSQTTAKPATTPTSPTEKVSLKKAPDPNKAPRELKKKPQLKRQMSVSSLILTWCKDVTQEYEGVNITNFSGAFSNGLAFCALIHKFNPDKFDYNSLSAENREYNFKLAFETGTSVGIPALLDVEDMVRLKKPEPRSVQCYVQMIFSKYRPKDMDMSNLIIA